MKRIQYLMVLVILMVWLVPCWSQNSVTADPKIVLDEFSKALQAENLSAARNLVWRSNPTEVTFFDAMAQLAIADNKLRTVAQKTFGDAALSLLAGEPSPGVEFKQSLVLFEKATAEINGDTAILKPTKDASNPKGSGPTVYFHFAKDGWKLDSEKTFVANGQTGDTQRSLAYLQLRALVLDALRGKIENKEISDLESLKVNLHAALVALDVGTAPTSPGRPQTPSTQTRPASTQSSTDKAVR